MMHGLLWKRTCFDLSITNFQLERLIYGKMKNLHNLFTFLTIKTNTITTYFILFKLDINQMTFK